MICMVNIYIYFVVVIVIRIVIIKFGVVIVRYHYLLLVCQVVFVLLVVSECDEYANQSSSKE
jgi:hypothetical protein